MKERFTRRQALPFIPGFLLTVAHLISGDSLHQTSPRALPLKLRTLSPKEPTRKPFRPTFTPRPTQTKTPTPTESSTPTETLTLLNYNQQLGTVSLKSPIDGTIFRFTVETQSTKTEITKKYGTNIYRILVTDEKNNTYGFWAKDISRNGSNFAREQLRLVNEENSLCIKLHLDPNQDDKTSNNFPFDPVTQEPLPNQNIVLTNL